MVSEAMLAKRYRDDVAPALQKAFGYSSPMAIPGVKKIVLNMGVGDAVQDVKTLDKAAEELAVIAGFCPAITPSSSAA